MYAKILGEKTGDACKIPKADDQFRIESMKT